MRVLLDTNVVLDILLRRQTWLGQAERIWHANIHYISRRLAGAAEARQAVRACLDVLTILPVDDAALEQAYALGTADFEDALQIACAVRSRLDAIVTRDPAGFAAAAIPIVTPADLAAQLPPETSS